MPAKKKPTTHRRKTTNKAAMRSFRVAPADKPFLTFRFTVQSLYWIVIGVLAVCLIAWAMSHIVDTSAIYDRVDALRRP